MDKEYLTSLTNEIYRLTLFFPKKEPLRYKLRELAGNILTNLVTLLESDDVKSRDIAFEIKRNIDPLDSFFEVIKGQNWVSPEDVSAVQEKYSVIKQEVDRFISNIEKEEVSSNENIPQKENLVAGFASLNTRQRKIIDLLRNKEKIQVGEAQESFPRITKRTLRRDFDALTKMGALKRVGKANLTFYKLADKEI